MSETEREGRRSLNRLRRAVEKSHRELDSLRGAIRHAEGDDFPEDEYDRIHGLLAEVEMFLDEEARRLREKILHSGGLEAGRVRRGS